MPANDPIPYLTTNATLLTALITLLLPLNAFKWSNFFHTATAALFITAYYLCCFSWMLYNWSNSISYSHCYSMYGPTNSATFPECLQMIQFLLFQPMLLWLQSYQLFCFPWMPTNDTIPSLTTNATLLTALLTLLLPLNALQMIQFLLLQPLLLYVRPY